MGNTNSTEANSNSYQQRRRSRSSSSTSIQQLQQQQKQQQLQQNPTSSSSTDSSTSSTPSISKKEVITPLPTTIVETSIPIITTTEFPLWSPKEPVVQKDSLRQEEEGEEEKVSQKMSNYHDQEEEQGQAKKIVQAPPTKAVPVATGKSGWVSSTGAASPWYGSLSSSTSSHHRASISGPYYRTRGMSVTRDNENDEELTANISSSTTTTATTTANPSTVCSPQPQQKMTISPTNHGVPTIITWAQGGNNVYVTGTFNGWKHKIKLIKSTHDFSAVLELPPGTHRLKFIVDDEWKCSNEMETATDPDGNLVNYLQVMDEDNENGEEEEEEEEENDDDFNSITSDGYTNIIPPELLQLAAVASTNLTTEGNVAEDETAAATAAAAAAQQKKNILEYEKSHPQPPFLPPHLEKVLLNSNTVSEEDNSVLHEPNHVTLNHLYACSIKDNVMALATTSRYRKKYVTTMYYRPVFPKN